MDPDRVDAYADFTSFAEACQHRMLRAAYLICGDPHLAEDLLQNALIKVALRWNRVRDAQPEAYLRTILYRDAVSWWRRRRREFPVARLPEPVVAPYDEDPAHLRVIFARAMSGLTPKQRAVLVLRFFEDQGTRQTAEILGVSVGTVKSQTSVALQRLREALPDVADLLPDRT